MGTTTVRISSQAHALLKQMAEADGLSLTDELTRIIEAQRRRRFLEELAQDFAALLDDPSTRDEVRAEQRLLEESLPDGLKDDPYDFSGFDPEELEADDADADAYA